MNTKLRPDNELLLPKITQLFNLGRTGAQIAKELGIKQNKVYGLQKYSFRKLMDDQHKLGFLTSNIDRMQYMNTVLFEKIEKQKTGWCLKRLKEINELQWLISNQDIHRLRVQMPNTDFDFNY